MYSLPFYAFAYEPIISWYLYINFNSIVRGQLNLIYTVLFISLVLSYLKVCYNSAEKCVGAVRRKFLDYSV